MILAYLAAKVDNIDLVGSNGMTGLMWASYMAYGYENVLSNCKILVPCFDENSASFVCRCHLKPFSVFQ